MSDKDTVLTNGKTVAEVPDYRDLGTNGQQKSYLVLSDEERAKGFVRTVRDSYVHVGPTGPRFPLRDLDAEELEHFREYGYTKYEEYPEGHGSCGRYWTQEGLAKVGKGCGVATKMARTIAETYAREPRFYGATFCVGCGKHLPVGEHGEFVWEGTDERVGS